MPFFALLILACVTVLGGFFLAPHLGTCLGGVLLAQIPFATSVRNVHRQVLESDVTDTDLKAAAKICVFDDVITPIREVSEYTLQNLVS